MPSLPDAGYASESRCRVVISPLSHPSLPEHSVCNEACFDCSCVMIVLRLHDLRGEEVACRQLVTGWDAHLLAMSLSRYNNAHACLMQLAMLYCH